MSIKEHQLRSIKVAEICFEGKIIHTPDDGLDLLGNVYYQGYDAIILHEQHLPQEFFELKTRFAGNLLQKFSNYRMPLAIIGDFDRFDKGSMHDFILESNQSNLVRFVPDVQTALQKLASK